jgi:hypothetical protein
MGRELKRVPLEFDWPRGETWGGYVNPFSYMCVTCPECKGCKSNANTREVHRSFYDLEKNGGKWHDNITQDELDVLVKCNRYPGQVPTLAEINARQAKGGLDAHDGINRRLLVETRAKRMGVYGPCPRCWGDGRLWPAEWTKIAAEHWQKFDPPRGDGYQLWEDTTEGSPVSPVFSTLDELSAWCAEHATTYASMRASAEEWRRILRATFAEREGER